MAVEAQQVLEQHIGDSLQDLGDILDYLVSVVEESSIDLEESIETLASMLEGAVEEDRAQEISKLIISQYNEANGLSEQKVVRQNQLLDAPVTVEIEKTTAGRDWIKQADQVLLALDPSQLFYLILPRYLL